MELRNARGDPVDPVPFLVVTGIAFATCFSYGPIYFTALGLGLRAAVGITTGAFLASALVAFYRMVWTARPDLRGEVPAARRFRRLILAIAIGVVALIGLSLPLLVGE
jgi:hypothetical protein